MGSIKNLLDRVKTHEDSDFRQDAAELIRDMQQQAIGYVRAVAVSEQMRLFFADGSIFADAHKEAEELEKLRTNAHNAFIGLVDAVNILCDQLGCERVYIGAPHRRAYGDFAFEIVEDLFENRK